MDITNAREAVRHLQSRGSCRAYADTPVEQDTLDLILDAALHAASGGNLQPVSIIVERDPARRKQLSEINGHQPFIAQAPVDLIFLLDWGKMARYAAMKDAPFQCQRSYMHFLIGLEDVMCAAQTVETAAHLLGLGSCYVGTSNHCGAELAAMYDLPQMTYPVVILALGHPKKQPPVAPKLSRDVMVFESRYPALSDDAIFAAYEAKYQGTSLPLPEDAARRDEDLDEYARALAVSFAPEKVSALVQKARQDGCINETQRRFGLHYPAADMFTMGGEILHMMADQGLTPFDAWLSET
jgi:FMN reductase [NAD(P)H]